jgi:flagellar protein FliJ
LQRFEFRLERVLKLKKQREWLAELRQTQARAVLDAAQAEVDAINDRIAQHAVDYALRLGRAEQGPWLGRFQQAVRLGDLLAIAEGKVRLAMVKYQEASAARTLASQEVEALLFLRTREWDDHRALVQRTQQEQLDEVSMRLWRTGQTDPSRGS